MNIHEYQAKEILESYGLAIPKYGIAKSAREAKRIAKRLGLQRAVIKAQVHAGGRGKAGGVKIAENRKEIGKIASQMVGMKLVTPQTGAAGIVVDKIMVCEVSEIAKEFYLGCVIDRESKSPVLIASPEGGVDIETVAAQKPDRILTVPIRGDKGLRGYQLLEIAKFMGWSGPALIQGRKMIAGLVKAFTETDASLLEINPLIQTPSGDLLALDAKLSVDDNALFRQKKIAAMYDPTQLRPAEARAHDHELSYVALEGDIGCMVNGAGLAMATMDLIKLHGGEPANFLDVGGSATKEVVAEGFKIILSDPKVKAILVNIFGGIMNCTTIAEGIIAAARELNFHVPVIVRMEGTHVGMGREMLAESGVAIVSAEKLADAAKKAVKAAQEEI